MPRIAGMTRRDKQAISGSRLGIVLRIRVSYLVSRMSVGLSDLYPAISI